MRLEANVEEMTVHGSDEPIITHFTIDEKEIDVNSEGISFIGLRYDNGLLQNLAISTKDLYMITDLLTRSAK